MVEIIIFSAIDDFLVGNTIVKDIFSYTCGINYWHC